MKIGVGSTNPTKVEATRQAVAHVHEHYQMPMPEELRAVVTESGVAAQPWSDEETRLGARQRAQAVLRDNPDLEIAFGLEGGVTRTDEGVMSTVWICVRDRQGNEKCANGARFLLPPELVSGLESGKEMGDVMDEITQRKNVKHDEGMIGVFTNGAVTRASEYGNLATLAYALYAAEFMPAASLSGTK